jgi:hypothetical protein
MANSLGRCLQTTRTIFFFSLRRILSVEVERAGNLTIAAGLAAFSPVIAVLDKAAIPAYSRFR